MPPRKLQNTQPEGDHRHRQRQIETMPHRQLDLRYGARQYRF